MFILFIIYILNKTNSEYVPKSVCQFPSIISGVLSQLKVT